jgi:hypothetical protein
MAAEVVARKKPYDDLPDLATRLHVLLSLTGADEGMAGAVSRAREIVHATPRAFSPRQFENEVNPAAHGGSGGWPCSKSKQALGTTPATTASPLVVA